MCATATLDQNSSRDTTQIRPSTGDMIHWRKQRGENAIVISFSRRRRRLLPREFDLFAAAVAEGISSMETGKGRPAKAVFAEIRAKHGLESQLAFLRERAARKMARMVSANVRFLGTEAEVAERFRISPRRLRTAIKSDRAIAYQHGVMARYLYPLEQFSFGGIADWATKLVAIVGNSDAALHFLWAGRRSLGWRSFAQQLRESRNHVRVVQRMLERARSLMP